jgi:3-hydroxyisobutyrate dehydrogenase-like beta-hydroxyacid dehydrogenase
VTVLGAPVSGGTSGAADGALTTMVGGDRSAFEACKPYLETFTSNVFYLGADPGYGHATKLLNNYLSITAMVATSEAIVLGRQLGLDVETMCEVFNASSGRNSATEEKFPDYVSAGRDVEFSLGLVEKDIDLLTRCSNDNRLPLLLARVVRSQVGCARAKYGEDGDMTDLYDYVCESVTGRSPGSAPERAE